MKTTKTDEIADILRRQIGSGELAPDSALPSERELGELYRVARGTVRDALRQLIHEGLVQARTGQGHYVRSFKPLEWRPGVFEHSGRRGDTAEAGADAWSVDVIAQHRVPAQDVAVSIVAPQPLVAARLHIPDGEMVVTRQRVRYVDEVPFQTADTYYPRDVAEGTPIMTPGDVTVPGGLMAAAGHPQKRFLDEIRVRMPNREEAFRLRLPAGTPVAEHVRTGYNRDGRPVRVIITIVPGDRHTIVYEVAAE